MSFARTRRAVGRALRSTSARLTAWYLVVFAASVGLLAWLAERHVARSIEQREQREMAATLDEVGDRWRASGREGLGELLRSPERSGLLVRVTGAASETLFVHGPAAALVLRRERTVATAVGSMWAEARSELDGTAWSVASAEADGGSIEVGRSLSSAERQLTDFRDAALRTLALALVLGLAGGAWLTHRALRPARQLAAITRGIITSGRSDRRVPVRGSGDELDELAGLYNTMLDRNHALVRAMRDALDDVAHDLRTPLARMRTVAELALGAGKGPGDEQEALATVVEESDQVLGMLRSMMEIAEAEAGVMRLAREPLDLRRVAEDVAEAYQLVAEDRGLRIVTHADGAASVSADPARIRQAAANLVDNALKYSDAGGVVDIVTRGVDGGAELAVVDRGIGIAPEEQQRIFQRLYRADRSRARPGLGLGLSLVRAIAEAHGGSVRVESAPGEGSTFTLSLPAR